MGYDAMPMSMMMGYMPTFMKTLPDVRRTGIDKGGTDAAALDGMIIEIAVVSLASCDCAIVIRSEGHGYHDATANDSTAVDGIIPIALSHATSAMVNLKNTGSWNTATEGESDGATHITGDHSLLPIRIGKANHDDLMMADSSLITSGSKNGESKYHNIMPLVEFIDPLVASVDVPVEDYIAITSNEGYEAITITHKGDKEAPLRSTIHNAATCADKDFVMLSMCGSTVAY